MADMEMVNFKLHARYSVVATVTKEQVVKPLVVDMEFGLEPVDISDETDTVVKAILELHLKTRLNMHFINRLKEDAKLKHRIGKTKWEIKLHEFTYKRTQE